MAVSSVALRRALQRPAPRHPRAAGGSVRRAVRQFALAGLVALTLTALAGVWASRQAAQRQSVSDARLITRTLGQTVVAPTVTDPLLNGDPAAMEALDTVVRRQVLGDGVVRVKVWTPDGRILYSDEPRIVGKRFDLGPDEQRAIAQDRTDAAVSDLSEPENRYERAQGKLLEVYLPLRTSTGRPVLFETYSRYDSVAARTRTIWRDFVPITLGLLLLLQLVQLPLAASLARRLERGRREREALLQRAITASDAERRRIAGDLHDGVVQDLAGVSYGIVGCADSVARAGRPDIAEHLYTSAGGLRQSIRALRSLLVEIYPPNLRTAGLAAALADLVAPLAGRAVRTDVDVPADLELSPETEALVFRVAQEAVRNATQHAEASRLGVRVHLDGDLVLTVTDDGVGFDPAAAPGEGHVGLFLLADLAADAAGRLEVLSAAGAGTTVRLEVPLP